MSKVVQYQPGKRSVVELGDGELIMVSIGTKSLWIQVGRRWRPVQRIRLPRNSGLLEALLRLLSGKTLLAATRLRPLRWPDGQPLEGGIRLLENLTAGLETCVDLAEVEEFVSQIEMQHLGLRRCLACRQTRELAYFALDDSKPSGQSDVCVSCDQSGAWGMVQKLKEELASLAPEERERRFLERGRELVLVRELSPELRFPSEYQGVKLDDDEREFIANYLAKWLGNIPPDMSALLQYLYVADALFSYSNSMLGRARENRHADLLRAACLTAEKGMRVARDECCFVYEYAQCLDAAGSDKARDFYQLFLERSAKDPGVRGSSAAHGDYFKRAVAQARERLK